MVESISAMPEQLAQNVQSIYDLINSKQGTIDEFLSNERQAASFYNFVSEVEEAVRAEMDVSKEPIQNILKDFKDIAKEAHLNLQMKDSLHLINDPSTQSFKDDQAEVPLDERINLITQYMEGAISQNDEIESDLLTDRNMSLNMVYTMKELETLLKKEEPEKTQHEIDNEKYYKDAYHDVVDYAIQMAQKREDRSFLIFLSEYERLSMIDKVYENDDSPLEKILLEAMDYQQEMANPEAVAYYLTRNYEKALSEAGTVEIEGESELKHMAALELFVNSDSFKELDKDQKANFQSAIDIVEHLKNNLSEDQQELFEHEQVRYEEMEFDNVPSNKKHLSKRLVEEGYQPSEDVPGQWERSKYAEENSVKQVAYWNEKLREKLLEENMAYLKTYQKLNDWYNGHFKASSMFSSSVVSKDEYGHPTSTLYNIGMSGAMTFTQSGIQDKRAYETAALNARSKGWKTVNLSYNGNFQEGVQFMKNSIDALVHTGGYDINEINVPRKYRQVLEKAKDELFRMEPGDPNQPGYVNAEYLEMEDEANENRQDEKTQNRRNVSADSDNNSTSSDSSSEDKQEVEHEMSVSSQGEEVVDEIEYGMSAASQEPDEEEVERDLTADDPLDQFEHPPNFPDDLDDNPAYNSTPDPEIPEGVDLGDDYDDPSPENERGQSRRHGYSHN